MTGTSPTTAPTDAGTPRVEVSRIANGTRTWKVVVAADDASEAAMTAAKDLAIKLDADLAVHYDKPA
jgi:hypothetical protein